MQEALPFEAANGSKSAAASSNLPAQRPLRAVPAPARPRGYDGPADYGRMWKVAEHLSEATILPRHFHNNAANVFAVMTQARAADIPVFTALQHMNVIDGRIEESAELVRAMLLAAGIKFTVVESTNRQATVELTRPGEEPQRVTFTMAQAATMGLADKRNWKLTPDAMLVARATTRAASWFAPDATMGLANLSHADLGDEAPEALEHLRPEDIDSPAMAARGVLDAALKADTAAAVRDLGRKAQGDGLLTVMLGDATLQTHLMERLTDLAALEAVADTVDGESAADGEQLACGCPAAQVLAAGEHQEGCTRGRA